MSSLTTNSKTSELFISLVRVNILRKFKNTESTTNIQKQKTDGSIVDNYNEKRFCLFDILILSTFIDGIYENTNIIVALQMIWYIKSVDSRQISPKVGLML